MSGFFMTKPCQRLLQIICRSLLNIYCKSSGVVLRFCFTFLLHLFLNYMNLFQDSFTCKNIKSIKLLVLMHLQRLLILVSPLRLFIIFEMITLVSLYCFLDGDFFVKQVVQECKEIYEHSLVDGNPPKTGFVFPRVKCLSATKHSIWRKLT